MRRTGILIIAVFIALSFATGAGAEMLITIDLDELEEIDRENAMDLREKVQENKRQREMRDMSNPDTAEHWSMIGESIAIAIKASCEELDMTLDEFMSSPVGVINAALIIVEVLGADIWTNLVTIATWIIVTAILLWSYRHFHMRERVESVGEGGRREVNHVERFEFDSNDAKTASAIAHLCVFAAITITSLVIVL